LTSSHQAVLLTEAVSLLKPGVGKVIVDGTLGGGGHAEALLEEGAIVVGIDRDPRSIEASSERLARFASRFNPIQGNYADAESLLGARGLLPVDGILLDLGISSIQLDEPARGFSFQVDGPLDMRMEQQGTTAAELIRATDEQSLSRILWELGEERFARPIARALKRSAPETTFQAVSAIKKAVPRRAWPKRIHVATRTFQALRIAVNRELEALDGFLAALPNLLKVGGVAAVIAFHSLEDRRVKQRFRELGAASFKLLTRKAIQASQAERDQNPRARSARLRAIERVG
jgi:16S rRNA (cytosine1402-N4)-methyltransferase